MTKQITILGAGVVGLWQALLLARQGKSDIQIRETSSEPFARAASAYAGTMLAPDCEFPNVQSEFRPLAREGLQHWVETFDDIPQRGSLVIANDGADIQDFANQSENYQTLSRAEITDLEPDLGTRFAFGLYYKDEAHLETDIALHKLLKAVQDLGVAVSFGVSDAPYVAQSQDETIIDCRGFAAKDTLDDLRGVRGERVILKTDAIHLTRPIRLLHLRQPIYVVPWGNNRFMVGATMVESEDESAITVRSALDLLAMAYQLNPAFGEAEVIDMGSGVRPAFPDNLPRIKVGENGRRIFVNGLYRHGYLLAPVLADITAAFLADGTGHPWLSELPESPAKAPARSES